MNKKTMRVLVIGGGGREHALAWRLANSPRMPKIFVAPGNAGTAREDYLDNVPIGSDDFDALLNFARQEKIDLTVVGPEAPLAAGVVDQFQQHGLAIFGPSAAAAQLESSKGFAKAFMQRHNIPTADFRVFEEAEAAHAWLDEVGAPIVVKADGLAAGKGVIVAMSLDEAHAAVDQLFLIKGARIVIEEYLQGEEASFITMVDGKNVLPLASCQDHKRVGEGDSGANTGGMGAYSPAPIVTPGIHFKAMRQVILPAVQGMAQEGNNYVGFLYAGLMIDANGELKTLEFNCRLGDPETQPVLMRLKSDLLQLIENAMCGQLDQAEVIWDQRVALGVVMAAENYPQSPRTGDNIGSLPPDSEGMHVFHAGTALNQEGEITTSGGRVLCVTTLGSNVKQAQQNALDVCGQIDWPGAHYRRDIGFRAIK